MPQIKFLQSYSERANALTVVTFEPGKTLEIEAVDENVQAMIDTGICELVGAAAPALDDGETAGLTVAELETMSVADLKALAEAAGIEHVGKLKKAELVAALTPAA